MLILSFLLRRLLFLLLLRSHNFIQRLSRNVDILKIYICRLLKRIYFSDCSLDFIGEFMRSNTLHDSIVMVREDNVALRIELEDEMIGKCFTSEADNHYSFNTDLSDRLYSF